MATTKKDEGKNTALVTGRSAAGNPNLDRVVDAIMEGYKPNRAGKSVRQLRIDHTAMKPLEKPIYGIRKMEGADDEIRLLWRAGWYLSAEENYVVEQILADPEQLKVNEQIWAAMEQQGIPVEKEAAEVSDAKVVQ